MTTGAQTNYAARLRAAGIQYEPLTVPNFRDDDMVWTFNDIDLTDASFRLQVRARPDASGAALAQYSFTKELIAGDTVVTGTLSKAAIQALPAAAEPGTAALLYYDFTVEPEGAREVTLQAGEYYRVGSVTQ